MSRNERSLSLIGMSWRNLYRQKLRTSLTVLGVAVGVVAIVALGSINRGLWASTDAAIHNAGVDLSVFQAGVAADLLSSLDEVKTRAALAADPDVEESFAVLTHILPVEGRPFFLIFGIGPNEMTTARQRPGRGRTIQADDEVALGVIAERILGKSLGDELTLAGQAFRIVAIFDTGVVFFDGGVVLSLSALQRLIAREGRVTNFQVRLRAGADPKVVAERLERNHPELVAIAGVEDYRKVDKGLEIADAMVGAVSLIALIIGSVIVTNTMWMSVHERTREIGVLRAMGWSRRGIIAMIMTESAGIGLLGCIVGSGLGVGLAEATTALPLTRLLLHPVFEPSSFLLAFGVAVSLSVLGGALPAWRAAHISPVEALRHE
ncbi:MAG: FtsX-like permease family protein [Planctomycetes bacterium]|nr:FtsX-like permease family protein [Planctomycetota bacterium]